MDVKSMRSIATTTVTLPLLATLLAGVACSSTGDPDGTGGTPSSGGNTSTAGTPAMTAGSNAMTAGSPATGGTPATGGAPATGGGSTTGGSPATGGGGSPATGGGGSPPTGGSPNGGSGGGGGMPADVCPTLPTAPLAASAITEFNDNGGWCWYQDERAVVDTKNNRFVIGSVAFNGAVDGDIVAVVSDFTGANKKKYTLATNLSPDDHNAPAFNIRPDGKIAAMWAGHREDCNSYYSVFDGTAWAATKSFNWAPKGCPWDGSSQKITYSNMWYLDGKLYSAVRSVNTSPNLLQSPDDGGSFDYYGRITATPTTGYVAGYYRYWGNNTDRLDFVATEAHPRDADTSLWHGYISGGKVFDSKGTAVDDNVADATAQNIDKFTQVFKTGTTIGGVKLEHMWNHDIARYADGTIAVLGQGRVTGTGSDDPDKRMIYARYDGTSWKSTYLVKAGKKLYSDEQDYTGLSALHPDNPHVIFVSTTYDPRDESKSFSKHEIFMGVTCDDGATFKWAPITENSTVDQLRPIVPKWDSTHTLLLWMQGTYNTAQKMTMKIVGTTALGAAPVATP
jgi:hypothetical protein